MVIATAGIEAAASQLLPARSNAERLLRQAFLALVKELRGQPLPDASREALAEQFPALQPAPQQATAEPTPAPQVNEVAELVAQLRSRHFGPDALDLAASFLEQLITSEPVAWCRSDEFANAMERGGSFNGWQDPGQGANRCDMPLYASPAPQQATAEPSPAPGPQPCATCPGRHTGLHWRDLPQLLEEDHDHLAALARARRKRAGF